MKILLVAHGFPPRNVAGTETYTFNLAKELIKKEEVSVFYRFADPKIENYTVEKGFFSGIPYWAINNCYQKNNSFEAYYRNKELERSFVSCLKNFHPDLVHFTYILGGLSADYPHLVRDFGAKIVITLTDFVLLCARGQLLNRQNEICAGPKNGINCVPCLWGKDAGKKTGLINKIKKRGSLFSVSRGRLGEIRQRLYFLKNSLTQAQIIIAPTRFLGNKYIEWGVPKKKVVNLGFGVNERLFNSFKKIPGQKLRFAFIGQLLPHKGLHLLTDALKGVKGKNWELKIYGDCTYPEAKSYLDTSLKGTDKNKIKYQGTFPFDEVARVYQEIDVLVIPSLWHENSPLVLLYALCTKTPVIAANGGGMAEFIDHKKTGMLFEIGEVEGLKKILKEFIDDPGKVQEFRTKIGPAMSIREHVQKIEEIYRNLFQS